MKIKKKSDIYNTFLISVWKNEYLVEGSVEGIRISKSKKYIFSTIRNIGLIILDI